jgi:hypothetical protein
MSRRRLDRSGARQIAAVVAAGAGIVLGLLLVLLASAPIVQTRVVSAERDAASGVSRIVLAAPDGVTASWPSYSDAPGVGASVAAVRLPNGALVQPGWTEVARDTGVVLVVVGALIGIHSWWRARHPNPPDKSLVTPGEAVVFPAVKMPGGGMG